MKQQTRRILISAAVLLLLALVVPPAYSYIFTYTKKNIKKDVSLHYKSEIKEEIDYTHFTKELLITADKDSDPIFVRAIGFTDMENKLEYRTKTVEGQEPKGKWEIGEGDYYYYSEVLNAGESAEPLIVYFGEFPKDAKVGDDYHVLVIYEATPAIYTEDAQGVGSWSADWSKARIIKTQEGQ